MDTKSLSHRRFTRRTALLSGTAALSGAIATPELAAVDSAASPEGEARLANIIRVYGSRLSPEQINHLRRILSENQRMLTRVRAFPLNNNDTPASVLKLRGDIGSSTKR